LLFQSPYAGNHPENNYCSAQFKAERGLEWFFMARYEANVSQTLEPPTFEG
jgi:hypothetical protein